MLQQKIWGLKVLEGRGGKMVGISRVKKQTGQLSVGIKR